MVGISRNYSLTQKGLKHRGDKRNCIVIVEEHRGLFNRMRHKKHMKTTKRATRHKNTAQTHHEDTGR